MKALFVLGLCISPAFAVPATTQLTLVDEPGFNRMLITVDPGLFPDSSITKLSGMVDASFDVDPEAATTAELTLANGRVNGTPMNLSGGFGTFGYNINITNISAAIFTAEPPGSVEPATGEFKGDEHSFSFDQGNITGSALGETITESFSPANPAEGNGSSTGTVTLTPQASENPQTYRNFEVVLTLPVNVDDAFDAGSTSVDVTATGTIKAVGTLQVPLSDYIAWSISQGLPSPDPDGDANSDGVSNAIAWALGLEVMDKATPFLPKAKTDGSFQMMLPGGGSAAPIHLEFSENLMVWEDVPLVSPIPAGTSGPVTVSLPLEPGNYLRLRVDE